MIKTKDTKGITLVALVVTIIVLLILAGVTISFILGQNGILGKAQIAKEETRGASVEEQVALWKIEIEMKQHTGGEAETLPEILARLQEEKLLTAQEIDRINAEENKNKEITIGSRTISFQVEETGGNTEKDPNAEIIGDGSYQNGVNTPKLGSTMTPIVYDSTQTTANGNIPAYWRKATNEKEWYEYKDTKAGESNSSRWANAVTEDGSMWVWIPRYEYKIVSGEGTSTAGEIEINFIPTSTNSKNGGVTTGYRIHPAFEDGSEKGKNNHYQNGEWDKELDGIWVAKFEASRADSTKSTVGTSNNIKIQPDVKSWTSITIGDSYTNSLNMMPSYNSHMMKNSEWGACAYLSHSKYGRNKEEVRINNNSAVVTGGGDYRSNTNQSSTGNEYGIYDLSGGAWERTAGYITNGHAHLKTYGASLIGSNTTADINGYQTKSTKTVTVYPYNSSSDTYADNYTTYKGLKSDTYGYGDAILETSSSGSGSTSWNADYSYFSSAGAPFAIRGGYYGTSSGAGLFAFFNTNGDVFTHLGFRVVLLF